MVMLVFIILILFICLKTKCVFKYTYPPFLFQIFIIIYLHFYVKEIVSIFFILLFSTIDFSIYFLIKRMYRKRSNMINNKVRKVREVCFNDGGKKLINEIISLKEFGYIDFTTKKTIFYMELLIILLSVGELYV